MKKYFYLLLISLVINSPVFAEQVPGTTVSLTPPEGYSASSRFPGFTKKESGSSIMVNEIPGPFDKIIAGFEDKEKVQAQGIQVLSKTATKIQGLPSILLQLQQSAYGTTYKKWALILDRGGETTMLLATYPEATAEEEALSLKEALLSISLVEAGDPLESLSFNITPSPGLKIAKVIGQTVILNSSGKIPETDSSLPMMVVGVSATAAEIPGDKLSFAETRLKGTKGLRELSIRKSSKTKIAGLEGIVSVADAIDDKSNSGRFVYQMMLFDNSGYSILQGMVASEKEKEFAPVFEETANSFSMKEAK